jgi:hypothetical protein
MARIAPEAAAAWPIYRDLESTLAGVAARRANVSEVWAWLGSYGLAREYAARLFGAAGVAVVPVPLEHTAEELVALLATMSFWAQLSPTQRDAIAAETRALHERRGRPIRSSTVACLVTARRAPASNLEPEAGQPRAAPERPTARVVPGQLGRPAMLA